MRPFEKIFLLALSLLGEEVGRGAAYPFDPRKVNGLSEGNSETFTNGVGNIGCLFSKEICDDKSEWCFNDAVFGRCLPIYELVEDSLYRYDLEKPEVHVLENEMERLFGLGYRWNDAYTQCILQNLLDSIRHGEGEGQVDRRMCDEDSEKVGEPSLDDQILDPDSLAFVSFKPSERDPHPEFADEFYVPSLRDLEEIDLLAQSIHPNDFKSKLENDMVPLPQFMTPEEEQLLEATLEEYLAQNYWKNKGKGKVETANKRSFPFSQFDSPGMGLSRSKGFMNEDEGEWLNDQQPILTHDTNGFEVESSQMSSLAEPIAEEERALEPRIFSGLYNTPDLFRKGVETRDVADMSEEDPLDNNVNNLELDPPVPNSIYTEGGLVYLNNPKRFLLGMEPEGGEDDMKNLYDSRNGFERRERLDVKKPGPWYRTVNNFAFDNEEPSIRQINEMLEPEFETDQIPLPLGTIIKDDNNKEHVIQMDQPLVIDSNEIKEAIEEPRMMQLDDPVKKKSSEKTRDIVEQMKNDGNFDVVDMSFVNIFFTKKIDWDVGQDMIEYLSKKLSLSTSAFSNLNVKDDFLTFKVEPNVQNWNASEVKKQLGKYRRDLETTINVQIKDITVGHQYKNNSPEVSPILADTSEETNALFMTTFAVCGIVAAVIVAAFAIFLIRKHAMSKEKFTRLAQDDPSLEAQKDYQDLCRARMASKTSDGKEKKGVQRVGSTVSRDSENGTNSSRSSSSSSWNEEPVISSMDISTGHMVLAYMEDHLKKKDRLDREWAALNAYEADPCSTAIGEKADNAKKNRFINSLPYDHSRVVLSDLANLNNMDYINASTITDHDPRNPAYIATQGPLPTTAADFWQMVWEQGSVVIVTLTNLADNGTALCHRYWPEEGSEVHHIYEVHLVSEHIWCDEYLVRSFYLKNLKTGETRTVTQFHFLAWPENGIPSSSKALLEFRRKVNKSYRGRSCPIIVHCSDGSGRTGTYCLIDMVLNRIGKGAKEIDIAASLEHIRDQRPGMVRTKQQFEFVLVAVAEEVQAIIKALPQ